jgi:hypothetical protein
METSTDRALVERWVAAWREAGPALEEQRRQELEQLDTPAAIRQLVAVFAHAVASAPPSDTSGLVEQQRHFRRLAG